MVKEFFSPSNDQAFKQWLADNPNGFYLNEEQVGTFRRNDGKAIMHRANCPFLAVHRDDVSTTYSKVAAAAIDDLKAWLDDHPNITMRPCHICKL